MKLAQRERVDGTDITIGFRIYSKKKENLRIGNCYVAEYRDLDGKQICRSLDVKTKAQARRKALEIQQEIESGEERRPEIHLPITELTEAYQKAVEIKGVAPKTRAKYDADLDKFTRYCTKNNLRFARHFTEHHLYSFRQWLIEDEKLADKTVQGAVVLTKQLFKWAWRQKLIRDYRFAGVSFPKAKSNPQPSFTSEQVNSIIEAGSGEEKLAFALMGYAGLRIGEVEQLHWEDLHTDKNGYTMIHVRRGGSNGTTKDKDDRFVPIHPTIALMLGVPKKRSGLVFATINERKLLKRIKALCKQCKFANPNQYKLHSFRHHFASLCANHHVAYRKALAWLGHSSSDILDLYYHLHDEDSRQAMAALANSSVSDGRFGSQDSPFEGNLRANGESKIEKLLQVPEFAEFTNVLFDKTERAGL